MLFWQLEPIGFPRFVLALEYSPRIYVCMYVHVNTKWMFVFFRLLCVTYFYRYIYLYLNARGEWLSNARLGTIQWCSAFEWIICFQNPLSWLQFHPLVKVIETKVIETIWETSFFFNFYCLLFICLIEFLQIFIYLLHIKDRHIKDIKYKYIKY